MKPYKVKAVVWTLAGFAHVALRNFLPNQFMAGFVAIASFALGLRYIFRWWDE